MPQIQNAGPNSLLQSSALGAGAWSRIHPNIRNLTIQASRIGSSVGALVSGTVDIEVSNDGTDPVGTKAGSIAFSSVASPAVDGFTIDSHWEWIRANVSSNSTAGSSSSTAGSTLNGSFVTIASAHNLK